MDDAELQMNIDSLLAAYPSPDVYGEVKDGVVRLVGAVETEEQHQETLAAVRNLPGVREVKDETVLDLVPVDGAHLIYHPERPAELSEEGTDITYEGTEYDFNDEQGTTDVMEAISEAEPFFPPTDTVIRPRGEQEQGYDIVGGFAPTATADQSPSEPPFSSIARGDEEIADDVRRELAEDGQTTDLSVGVTVRNGIVYLRGTVASLEDAEAAEGVAARVDGVVEVQEDLNVAA